ncbi:ABC transporter permease [Alcaligenaceae bacterium 429]|nr:ABC transporter permease [Alcaligenaceae bacterium 429]
MPFPNPLRLGRLALAIIVIPMLVAILYYVFLASNRYVSSSQVVVRQAESGSQAGIPGLALLMSSIDPVSREETLYLREYVTSSDMLNYLDEKIQWAQHFEGRWNDPLFWLPKDATQEEKLEFYQRLVTATYDEMTGLLNVEVQALTPEFSEETLQNILQQSENFVNEISRSIAKDQLAFAQGELKDAAERYEDSKAVMLEFQRSSNLLNAQATAESRAMVIAELEAEIVKEHAKLKSLLSTLSNSTPQVRAQQVRVRALEQQLAVEKQRLVSAEVDGEKLNVVAAQYRRLEIDVGIAEEFYKTSMAVVENAKLEASKKIRSLVKVVQPNMPEDSIYPRRVYNLIALFIILCLVYGITRFVIASIEDHRE